MIRYENSPKLNIFYSTKLIRAGREDIHFMQNQFHAVWKENYF